MTNEEKLVLEKLSLNPTVVVLKLFLAQGQCVAELRLNPTVVVLKPVQP